MNHAKPYDYDLFVIGGGSGGVRAARVAAGHGARVGIAEEFRFGGTCVIRGCVPKKLLVYASRFRDEFEDAADFGWTLGEARLDWPKLIAAKDREIARLEKAYSDNLDKANVTRFAARAILDDAHTIRLADVDRRVTADRILIATGGKPRLDAHVPGIEHAITSNEIFHLPKFPARLVVVGGGYIALEFASLMHGLGAHVTLLNRGDEILRGFDQEVGLHLREALAARGVSLQMNAAVARIEKAEGGLKCWLVDGRCLDADQILYAIGRQPATAGIGLDAAGVGLGDHGQVKVDDRSRSSIQNIFAVGDVTDRVSLTPVAIREGHAFADSEFGNRSWTVDHRLFPSAVFTTPEVGGVGMTQAAACEKYRRVQIYRARFRPMRSTLGRRQERMLMKLLVDADSQRVIGAHVVGADAGEMAQLLAIPIGMGAAKADFDATIALHPSASEEWVTMRTPDECIER